MTVQELRNHKEYEICFEKIRSYPKGFTFTLNYSQIPRAKANALKIVMSDAVKQGLLEPTETLLAIDGTETGATFTKI